MGILALFEELVEPYELVGVLLEIPHFFRVVFEAVNTDDVFIRGARVDTNEVKTTMLVWISSALNMMKFVSQSFC